MTIPTTAVQFDEVLALARRARRVRLDLDQFETDRLGMYAALTQDWAGGARDEFDIGWDTTTGLKTESAEQLNGFETDLARLWADGVEGHNAASYNLAISAAGGAIAAEREQHYFREAEAASLATEAGLEPLALQPFNAQATDRVPLVHGDVSVPTEADDYSAGASFLHYERVGNYWNPSWRSYPDANVTAGLQYVW